MAAAELGEGIARIGILVQPVRAGLYAFVASRAPDAVSRSEAAAAVGVGRALASFHLDRLAEAGFIEPVYRRLTGRSGPGAGRPAKLYRRSSAAVMVSFPPRNFELAGRLLLRSSATQDGPDERMLAAARQFGRELGGKAKDRAELEGASNPATRLATQLDSWGFQPDHGPGGTIRLRNCPFHELAADYPAFCQLNLALQQGMVESLGASWQPAATRVLGYCCVEFQPVAPGTGLSAGALLKTNEPGL